MDYTNINKFFDEEGDDEEVNEYVDWQTITIDYCIKFGEWLCKYYIPVTPTTWAVSLNQQQYTTQELFQIFSNSLE